jgi:hypothetical protein
MAKSFGYVPATVKQIKDDMVLLIYQIMVLNTIVNDIPEHESAEMSSKFVSITKEARNTFVMMIDKMLVWP